MRRASAASVTALAALLLLIAAAPRAAAQEAAWLKPGATVRSMVATSDEGAVPQYRSYRFRVPNDAVAVTLELKARADLDLFVGERELEDYETDAVLRGDESTGTERITFTRETEPALGTGVYWVDVAFLRPYPPLLASGRELSAVPFALTVRVHRLRDDGEVRPGESAIAEVGPDTGHRRTYRVEVPEGAKALRLDLLGDGADLNLRVRQGKPILNPDDAGAEAWSALASEVLIIDGESDPPLVAGTYYVDVMDPELLPWAVPFELRASFDDALPADLAAIEKLPVSARPLDRARLGTVELLLEEGGGSGVMISDTGYLITNYHVVQPLWEGDGQVGGPLYIGLTLAARDPPRTRFQAEIVAVHEDLDLALCRCTKGRYGQPLPEGFKFPTVPIGSAAALSHGDPLWAIGYPDAGGVGTRVSVTVSRGVVAGFERRGGELHLKTDAEINPGNSGGAALNEAFELIGFPTETVADPDGNGQLGYIRPVWLVPTEWWDTAGVALPGEGK